MISLKSSREIDIIRRASRVLCKAFSAAEGAMGPGMTTRELDQIIEQVICDAGARPAFKGYRGFPAAACVSVNEQVVHGIPGQRRLKDGDVVSVDVGVKLEGYFSDAARTWLVGGADEAKQRLIQTAKDALNEGLKVYKPGCRIGDLSEAIQKCVESRRFQVVRDFVGHGIGRAIHEDPQVPNFGRKGHGPRIEPGLVLAIEPMVTEGHYAVETLEDGWTVVTKDRKLASHYEETVAFTDTGFEILTRQEE